ncbi:cystathionine gamma-synthase [Candidatus Micrarchaeota archaeon CG11_big_fil_rev_8_21_14_0_20_47_5]|nr:MAG: cystathionine gamma-synthase [Candidatus Micrarchaeota archaeon CG11_big_fil_rev_8_21_14_0_20_47_5]
MVASDDLYGGTRRLFLKTFGKFGLDFSFVDAREPANVESAIRENTKIVWLESPTNPTLKLCDIREISGIAHKGGAIAVVDNTFASPYFQNPLSLEADIVLHSATKYIGGHSNVINGAVMVSDEGLHEKLRFQQNAVGAVPSPFDAHTIHVQLKTLGLRMERHAQNAQDVAEFLEAHPKVKRVYYPGLKSHPQHELAKTQMRGFGGMVSFEIRGGMEAAARFLKSLEIFLLAESLGGVESLAEHPASMTHASVSREDRMRAGLSDGLVRLSVGIEDSGDLISDLDNSLK